jgi:hypothetical protein
MTARTRLLLPLAVLLALLPATGAEATKKATFSAVFEAKRSVAWDQPRSVSQITCRGEHYYLASGGEEAELRTKPFKVTAQRLGNRTFWTFGKGPSVKRPTEYGVEAKGPHKRWFDDKSGTTGGWCGGGEDQARPERDCGTKLPTYLVTFHALGGSVSWAASHAPWMANERLHFYKCTLVPPTGMHTSSFPRLDAKVKQADVFARGKRTIVVSASKNYGPDVMPITNSGVNRTTSGTVSWKLTLRRSR